MIQRSYLIIALLALLLQDCQQFTQKTIHTFRFDNRSRREEIHSLYVMGDFNRWQRHWNRLSDTDGDGIWTASVVVDTGWHQYRFVLNQQRVMKDPENFNYGGEFSNSIFYAGTKKQLSAEIFPAEGSRISGNTDSLRVRVSFGEQIRIDFKINGQTVPFRQTAPGLFSARWPALPEGIALFSARFFSFDGKLLFHQNGLWLIDHENLPPRAHAGYQLIRKAGERVVLSAGLSSDPDLDDHLTLRWKQTAGPEPVTLSAETDLTPEFSAKKAGKYSFELTITDRFNRQSSDLTDVLITGVSEETTLVYLETNQFDFPVRKVALAGEFNQWNPNDIIFKPAADGSRQEINAALPAGVFEYKFVINDSLWLADPGNKKQVPDGHSGFNSVLEIQPATVDSLQIGTIRQNNTEFITEIAGAQRIQFHSDRHNGNIIYRQEGNSLYFDRRNKPGSYFFDVTSADPAHPLTLLIRHFDQTEVFDYAAAPAWFDQAVIYEIFIRGFSAEADLKGLIERLDYLKELGINTIWLMPVYDSPTDHGYAPTNLFDLESDYGNIEEYKNFIQIAHEQDFRVIFDFVGNHLSDQHPYVRAALNNPGSPFRSWFYWKPDGWWGHHNDWDTLVNLNFNSTNVRREILESARFWSSLSLDGFRCDVAWAVPLEFWQTFRREVKKHNPDCVLINEVLPRSVVFHKQAFDVSYDTDFYGAVIDVASGQKPVSALPLSWTKNTTNYPAGARSLRYLENHDLPRFVRRFGAKITRQMAVILFTLPGATPMLYYGQEAGELEMRPMFKQKINKTWLDFYTLLVNFRQSNIAARSGRLLNLSVDDERGFWHYTLTAEQNQAGVGINFNRLIPVEFKVHQSHSTILIENGIELRNNRVVLNPGGFIIYKMNDDEKSEHRQINN